jgi:hypothetical protein
MKKREERMCVSTQKYIEMGAAGSAGRLVQQYQTTRHHIPEESNIFFMSHNSEKSPT